MQQASEAPCLLFLSLWPLSTSTSSSDMDPNLKQALSLCSTHPTQTSPRACLLSTTLTQTAPSCSSLQLPRRPDCLSSCPSSGSVKCLWASFWVCLQVSSVIKITNKGSLNSLGNIFIHPILQHCLHQNIVLLNNYINSKIILPQHWQNIQMDQCPGNTGEHLCTQANPKTDLFHLTFYIRLT